MPASLNFARTDRAMDDSGFILGHNDQYLDVYGWRRGAAGVDFPYVA